MVPASRKGPLSEGFLYSPPGQVGTTCPDDTNAIDSQTSRESPTIDKQSCLPCADFWGLKDVANNAAIRNAVALPPQGSLCFEKASLLDCCSPSSVPTAKHMKGHVWSTAAASRGPGLRIGVSDLKSLSGCCHHLLHLNQYIFI